MKITRANVEVYAKKLGLEPVQIDGIPEGFSFKEPDLTIGDKTHKGRIIKFKPLAEWEDKNAITYE
jgi:hypothetical protein